MEYSLIIEDDGKVRYAYLILNNSRIGDVWLYNQADAPQQTTWKKEEMPFLNPIEYLRKDVFVEPIVNEEEVEVDFSLDQMESSLGYVKIFIQKNLVAIVKPGSTPGWSINVIKDGPLAKQLLIENVKMNSIITIFADFNNADKYGRIRLNTVGSISDIEELALKLEPGIQVRLDDHEGLATTGIVHFSQEENIWVAEIDWEKLK